jgi:hypothetical protein
MRRETSGLSRREFLRDAGLLVGGALGSSLVSGAGCTGSTQKADPVLITVLNPEGQPPPIMLASMAPRLDTMDGKKIYLVDIHFTGTQVFLEEMARVLQEKYPKSSFIYKLKAGAYAENDATLWEEIKQNGNAVLMGIGH